MAPVQGNIVKRADIVVDRDGNPADYNDRNEKAEGSEEKPFAACLTELPAVEFAQVRTRNDRDKNQ